MLHCLSTKSKPFRQNHGLSIQLNTCQMKEASLGHKGPVGDDKNVLPQDQCEKETWT